MNKLNKYEKMQITNEVFEIFKDNKVSTDEAKEILRMVTLKLLLENYEKQQ